LGALVKGEGYLACVEQGIIITSVGNPWLRHSSHPQEKEGGPKKNEKKKKKKNTSLHSPARPSFLPDRQKERHSSKTDTHTHTDRQTDTMFVIIYKILKFIKIGY
jgi:hypothetical protein